MSDPKATDAISRSAAVDIINEERRLIESLREIAYDNEDRAHNTGELGCAIRLARKIKELPALDVAPVVHARWEKTYDLIDGHDGYECSACGYTKYFDHYAEGIALCKPYCCNCGARMDGEAE